MSTKIPRDGLLEEIREVHSGCFPEGCHTWELLEAYDALVVERDRLLTWMSHYYEGDTDDSDEVPDDIADMVIVWQDSPPSSDA
jgi:hypothetical protein